jgi:hypothetical protein
MTELAQRGHVYEFVEKDGITVKNRVLVVSADSRAGDKLISILMLGDIGFGHDVVKIGKQYVHCGCVTYCSRDRLGRMIGKASKQAMEDIDFMLAKELGLVSARLTVYKELYDDMLRKMMEVAEHGTAMDN